VDKASGESQAIDGFVPRVCDGIRTVGMSFMMLLALPVLSTASAQDAPRLIDPRLIAPTTARVNPAAAKATPDAAVSPELLREVQLLDDPSYQARESAAAKLQDQSIDENQLLSLLAGDELSAEQRYRLVEVLRRRIIDTPRGAVGIRMQSVPPDAFGAPIEMKVMELLPGLPAERVLQVGDRVMRVDGQPFRSQEDLAVLVQNKKPGEAVQLVIKRMRTDDRGRVMRDANDQPILDIMNVDIVLGSADLLVDPDRMAQLNPVQRERSMRAQAIVNTFSPTARRVPLHDEAALFAMSDPQFDVDAHFAVQSLLLQKQYVADGRMTMSQPLLDYWRSQLAMLKTQAEQPNISDFDRKYLRKVAERYEQVMREDVQ
jgi:hypothetical protein